MITLAAPIDRRSGIANASVLNIGLLIPQASLPALIFYGPEGG
jgi:hypothetical protein